MRLFISFVISISTVKSYPQSTVESLGIGSPDIVPLNPTSSDIGISDLATSPPGPPDPSDSIIIADMASDIRNSIERPLDSATHKLFDTLEQLERRPIRCYGKYIKQLCCWGETRYGQFIPDPSQTEELFEYKSIGNCGPCRTATLFLPDNLETILKIGVRRSLAGNPMLHQPKF